MARGVDQWLALPAPAHKLVLGLPWCGSLPPRTAWSRSWAPGQIPSSPQAGDSLLSAIAQCQPRSSQKSCFSQSSVWAFDQRSATCVVCCAIACRMEAAFFPRGLVYCSGQSASPSRAGAGRRYGYWYDCLVGDSSTQLCELQPYDFRGCPCSDAVGRQKEYQELMRGRAFPLSPSTTRPTSPVHNLQRMVPLSSVCVAHVASLLTYRSHAELQDTKSAWHACEERTLHALWALLCEYGMALCCPCSAGGSADGVGQRAAEPVLPHEWHPGPANNAWLPRPLRSDAGWSMIVLSSCAGALQMN